MRRQPARPSPPPFPPPPAVPRSRAAVAEETPGGAVGRIDVFTLDGRLLGEWRDPPLFPDLLFADGLAAVLDRDELDARRVTLLRLREGGG